MPIFISGALPSYHIHSATRLQSLELSLTCGLSSLQLLFQSTFNANIQNITGNDHCIIAFRRRVPLQG